MRQVKALSGLVTLIICLGLWLWPAYDSAQSVATPSRSVPAAKTKIVSADPALDDEPRLRTRVWLIAPDSTIERLLAELSARTTPFTRLKLQAQRCLQPLPVGCCVAGVPLRDVLDGLTALGSLKWRRTSDMTLQLGVAGFDPQREERRNRIARYGTCVIAAYTPSLQADGMMPDRGEELRRDPRFARVVTINLRGATLPDALKALFVCTRLPLLAFAPQPAARADLVVAKLALSEALDRLCAAYGCRWIRRDSGLIVLLPNRE